MAERGVKKYIAQMPAVDLLGYTVTDVSFHADMENIAPPPVIFDRNDIVRTTTTRYNKENLSIWQVGMDLGIKKEAQGKYAYNWNISITGVFKVNLPLDSLTIEELEKHVRLNGATLLYTTAREYLRSLSSPALKGAFILPTVTFFEAPSPKQAKKKADTKA